MLGQNISHLMKNKFILFLISNFRLVLNFVFILLGNSPASEYKIQTPGNYPEEKHTSLYYFIRKSQLPDPILSQLNLIRTITPLLLSLV